MEFNYRFLITGILISTLGTVNAVSTHNNTVRACMSKYAMVRENGTACCYQISYEDSKTPEFFIF